MIDLRRSIANLHEIHLAPEALAGRIRYLVDLHKASRCTMRLVVLGEQRPVSKEVSSALYRIAQELLTNIEKHAQATQADITLEYAPASVRLTIADDGTGASSTSTGGYGLKGVEERVKAFGGTCTIQTALNQGFVAHVEVPT